MSESLIHIKLDYREALISKKSILSLEMETLKLIKILENYRNLRIHEFTLKENLKKKIKETTATIRKLERTLPKLKIPEYLKEDSSSEKIEKTQYSTLKHKESNDIESQLLEIQKRLDSLQSQNI